MGQSQSGCSADIISKSKSWKECCEKMTVKVDTLQYDIKGQETMIQRYKDEIRELNRRISGLQNPRPVVLAPNPETSLEKEMKLLKKSETHDLRSEEYYSLSPEHKGKFEEYMDEERDGKGEMSRVTKFRLKSKESNEAKLLRESETQDLREYDYLMLSPKARSLYVKIEEKERDGVGRVETVNKYRLKSRALEMELKQQLALVNAAEHRDLTPQEYKILTPEQQNLFFHTEVEERTGMQSFEKFSRYRLKTKQ